MSPSICFVAHNALGALCGQNQSHVGGIERQQATMAEWLAARGWKVSIVTWRGEYAPAKAKGVNIEYLCGKEDGIPGIRFFFPRWTSLNLALERADADIYYYNCGDLALGQLAMWARRRGVPYVFSAASDADCDPKLPALQNFRDRALYKYGLRRCNHVIVQSNVQRKMLETEFGKSSDILSMPCKGFLDQVEDQGTRRDGAGLHIIWVGRISPEKRIEWLLNVAQACTHARFTIIGAPNKDNAYARQAIERAESLPNVSLAGRVNYEKMGAFYHDADLLCCTSVFEGFPNVYLEAWSAGVPVITTVDPDGVIRRNEIGFQCESVEQIVEIINKLEDDVDARKSLSTAARNYFFGHHDINTAMRAFDKYFRQVLNNDRTRDQAT